MTVEIQEQNSAVQFATHSRVHVAINVSNIERSLPFYQVLFGQTPTKLRPGYAKFEVAEPPVNFTLNENPALKPGEGALSHFGIQVKSTSDVLGAKDRFIVSGLATFDETQTTCCYAVQDKVWITDPDGNRWEVFVVTQADAPVHSANRQAEEVCGCAIELAPSSRQTIQLVSSQAGKCCS